MTALFVFMVLLGRVTAWDHYPHYGGGNGITANGDVLMAATSGGLLFSHFSAQENTLVVDSGWSCPGKLSYDRVSHAVRDSDGNLWVSLFGGGIDVFSSTGNRIHYNQIDGLPPDLGINQTLPDSFVYVASTQGLCVKSSGFFETYNTFSTGGGLPSGNITCLAASDSGLYVGTASGLVFLPRSADPGTESSWVMQSVDSVSIIAMTWQNDTLWASTAGKLFRKPADLPWEEEAYFPGEDISSITWGDGGLAVGSRDACFVLSDGVWHTYNDNLYGNTLTGLVWHAGRLCGVLANPYAENRLSGAGLALLLEDGSWRRTFPAFGPVSNDLRDCTMLTDGSVWVSSNMAGASVFFNGVWQSVTYHMTHASQSFAVCPSGSGVFVSSVGYGLDWLSWQDGTVVNTIHIDTSDGLLNDRVFCAEQGSAGTVWFGHRTLHEAEVSGVDRLSWSPGDSTSVVFAQITDANGLPSKEVNAVLPMGSRYCWVGTDAGLALVDGDTQSVSNTYTVLNGLPSSLVTALAVDRSGTLYVGTASGLAVVEDGTAVAVDALTMGINALACDDFGSLWISTDDGLKRYFRASGSVEEYSTFNSPLFDGQTYAFAVDSDSGHLWMATDHGFWRGTLEHALSGDGSHAAVYPNPFLPGKGDVLGVAGIPDFPTEVQIYDQIGNLVYSEVFPGRAEIVWNGKDTDGEQVPSGIYFVRLGQGGSYLDLLKFALVR